MIRYLLISALFITSLSVVELISDEPQKILLLGGCVDTNRVSDWNNAPEALKSSASDSTNITVIQQQLVFTYEDEHTLSMDATLELLNAGNSSEIEMVLLGQDTWGQTAVEPDLYQAVVNWLESGDKNCLKGFEKSISIEARKSSMMLANCQLELDGERIDRVVKITPQIAEYGDCESLWKGVISFHASFKKGQKRALHIRTRMALGVETSFGYFSFMCSPFQSSSVASYNNVSMIIDDETESIRFNLSPALPIPAYDNTRLIYNFDNLNADKLPVKYIIPLHQEKINYSDEVDSMEELLNYMRSSHRPSVIVYMKEKEIKNSICLIDGLNIRQQPDSHAAKITGKSSLEVGEYFTIIGSSDDWFKIRTKNGMEGWIRWQYEEGNNILVYALPHFWGDP